MIVKQIDSDLKGERLFDDESNIHKHTHTKTRFTHTKERKQGKEKR